MKKELIVDVQLCNICYNMHYNGNKTVTDRGVRNILSNRKTKFDLKRSNCLFCKTIRKSTYTFLKREKVKIEEAKKFDERIRGNKEPMFAHFEQRKRDAYNPAISLRYAKRSRKR